MKLTKQQRHALHAKYDGRYTYCGDILPDRWHIDHIEPIVRNWWNGICEHIEWTHVRKLQHLLSLLQYHKA